MRQRVAIYSTMARLCQRIGNYGRSEFRDRADSSMVRDHFWDGRLPGAIRGPTLCGSRRELMKLPELKGTTEERGRWSERPSLGVSRVFGWWWLVASLVLAVGMQGPPAEDKPPAWLEVYLARIADPDPVVRTSARMAVVASDRVARSALASMTSGGQPALKSAAAEVLADIAALNQDPRFGIPLRLQWQRDVVP